MQYAPELDGPDLLGWWIRQPNQRGRQRARRPTTSPPPGIRFAFYGRMSTVDFQDRASSCRWQRNYAEDLIAGHGRIVTEFFDEGVSRRNAWPDRPQAALLLAAVADPARGFDAIVVGEYERAFHGQQLEQLTPTLVRHGVQLWLPETYGPVDFDNSRQLALLDLLGVHSQREVSRARHRTTVAMRAQAELQGRHLGGRPPYGYRLVDAGPHPNRAHAAWGRRLHRLEPDPATAPHVRWIFEQRLAGYSVASIARALNDTGIPCPSGADPARNPHRSGQRWMLTTVAAILANPRYTGRQVWNRQRNDHDDLTPDGTVARHREVQRWNAASQWVISRQIAHPPLVTEEQFVAAQAIHTAPTPADGAPRHYLLAGLVCCGICGRIMDSHWVHARPGYRCRHGHTSSRTKTSPQPKILYIREDHLLDRIRHDRGLHRHHPALRSPDPEKLTAYLRTNNMVIVCDHRAWTVEAETAVYPLNPQGSRLAATAKIPAQRDGDHAKHEKPSRFVWK
ncbi:recombinase family protein [Micromonospora sp. DR5-3]|uniref:recombinase family protein n=1 Tax=unclassified Micromonospora TaxID=2617518 RepID=UPI0011DA2041|nr:MULTISPECIES: recombinase family protein [unclassified Micromonospora]MCW3817758.1 recombinase family protein [Micromonospora sp. DR5-3]TYC20568.1 recombinase family protein [Micromonospora sp. MP36]